MKNKVHKIFGDVWPVFSAGFDFAKNGSREGWNAAVEYFTSEEIGTGPAEVTGPFVVNAPTGARDYFAGPIESIGATKSSKFTTNISDFKNNTIERYNEYDRRGWKHDETTNLK